MSEKYKIASGFAPFSPCSDRFNVQGYRDPMTLEEQFAAASKIEGLEGTGLDYPYQFQSAEAVRPLLDRYGLAFVTLEIGLYPDRKWKKGTYTAPDPGIRREAIEMSKKALDVAAELGAEDVLMWPGQDGFDYPFESDYLKYWALLVQATQEVALHRPDVKIAIEYKKQEPRVNCYIRNAGTLLTALARFVYMRKTFGHWYLDNAATYLPLSDLFRCFLTDRKESEETILWGSQLVDIRTRQWHPKLIDLFDIPSALLPDIVKPGTIRGGLKGAVEQETSISDTPVIAVAGHDTISASVSFTDRADDAAFVSIGTWSILGVLLPGPETGPDAYRRGFLNEIGVDSILFAKNLMGFYLLEALIQSWKMREIDATYERLIEEAMNAPEFALSIDVNDQCFFSAVNMEETLNGYLHASGQSVTDEIGILVRSILESLARSYARTIADLEKIFKTRVTRLTVLGGGVRNQLLCQMIADAADVKVVTGPAEATVMGNIGMQILATGALDATQALHPIMAGSSVQKMFRPENHGTWKEQAAGKEA